VACAKLLNGSLGFGFYFCSMAGLYGRLRPFSGAAGIRPVLQHGLPEATTPHPLFRQPPAAFGGGRLAEERR